MIDSQKWMSDVSAVREYARGGIVAATSINSAALLAVVAKITDLAELAPNALISAMTWWGGGLALSVFCWLAAFFAGNAYAKGEHRSERSAAVIGIAMFVAAVVCFFLGVVTLSRGIVG